MRQGQRAIVYTLLAKLSTQKQKSRNACGPVQVVLLMRLFCVFLLLTGQLWAQTLQPDQIMVLLIGPSAARPTHDQRTALQRLQAMRQQPGLESIKVGTMHFDRPAEARFASQVLGIDRSQLPCLALVQLDESGQNPVKKLYAIPRVSGESLDQFEQMGQAWAQKAGLSLQPGPGNFPEQGTRVELLAGQSLQVDEALLSHNRLFSIGLQQDGNLVVNRRDSQPFRPVWSSRSEGRGGNRLLLDTDGVLKITRSDGQTIWKSSNRGTYGFYVFTMQDDGNAVIYRKEGGNSSPVWATHSNRH